MPLTGPPQLSPSPLAVVLEDIRAERRATVPFPPGRMGFSLSRIQRITNDPLPMLLDAYARYGPVFTLRIMHQPIVFMIGPEANHYVLVSHASNFHWRESHFRELIGLLGDGLLTIDGEFHRRSRQIMLPAFHHKQIERSVEVIVEEVDRAIGAIRPGDELDFYDFVRRLALRVAMRAVFGLDPDRGEARRLDAAALFSQALSLYSRHPFARMLRGSRSPWGHMLAAREQLDRLIYAEIARRRESGERGPDVLSLLLDARDEEGATLTDRHIRDEVMTLLFAGHDTTTSTVAFMFYELARAPELQEPLLEEQRRVLGDGDPAASLRPEHLAGSGLPQLEMVLDETLRMYPPAWIGPRRAVEPFEFAGRTVPGGAYVNYSSWVTHHLPHLYPEPERFLPERFEPQRKGALPKGAYVPFGGGSRTCIGMRFGQLEIRTIATILLSRFALEVPESFRLRIRQAPTIGPRGGLPVIVGARPPARRGASGAPQTRLAA
jgi:cytochrome P450